MDIHLDAQMIVSAAAFLTAVTAIFVFVKKGFKWFSKPDKLEAEVKSLREKHENDMAESNEERQLICYALAACLDGLQQLGCNHTVTDAKNKMDKHLNEKAHNYKRGENL